MIVRSIAGALSPSGQRARLSIFIFHRVLSQMDALFPGEQDARRFNEVLSWVGQWFQVMPLDEAVSRLGAGTLPARAAAITFDDGYADNATNALPVLQHHGMAATFFIATSFLDGGRMWNDSVIEAVRVFRGKELDLSHAGLGSYCLESHEQRRVAIESLLGHIKYFRPYQRQEAVAKIVDVAGARLPDNLMLRSEQVLALRNAGMQIGAHTCSHPILEKISDDEALSEISNGKVGLESLLGEPVTHFAYPNGKPDVDYSAKHVAMVRQAGFVAAFSTAPGVAMQTGDVHQLPRFTPWDRTRSRYGMRLLANMRRSAPQVVASTVA
ncbi:MAG: polysaccharide deacetylase family protein [Rhodoferax sp.]|uniref:polysaccharide deacetylase family protein n=1 Tax=Rhodoferax sp. TaxID=50421 RepID=UPI0013FFBFFA|nr:polysaccharide deacetylase family protein [Rhodoferax sp.]NDP38237.1 polysaccharide deacetylase family protein [Rhodoferax sp.]